MHVCLSLRDWNTPKIKCVSELGLKCSMTIQHSDALFSSLFFSIFFFVLWTCNFSCAISQKTRRIHKRKVIAKAKPHGVRVTELFKQCAFFHWLFQCCETTKEKKRIKPLPSVQNQLAETAKPSERTSKRTSKRA